MSELQSQACRDDEGDELNATRVAALLRELAEALEAPEAQKRPRRLLVAPPERQPSAEARDMVRRAHRKRGVVRG